MANATSRNSGNSDPEESRSLRALQEKIDWTLDHVIRTLMEQPTYDARLFFFTKEGVGILKAEEIYDGEPYNKAVTTIARDMNAHTVIMAATAWTSLRPREKHDETKYVMPSKDPNRKRAIVVSGVSQDHPWSTTIYVPIEEAPDHTIRIGEPQTSNDSSSIWLDHIFVHTA